MEVENIILNDLTGKTIKDIKETMNKEGDCYTIVTFEDESQWKFKSYPTQELLNKFFKEW